MGDSVVSPLPPVTRLLLTDQRPSQPLLLLTDQRVPPSSRPFSVAYIERGDGKSRSYIMGGQYGRVAIDPSASTHLSWGSAGANQPHYTLHRDGTSSMTYEGRRRIWCHDEYKEMPRHLRTTQPLPQTLSNKQNVSTTSTSLHHASSYPHLYLSTHLAAPLVDSAVEELIDWALPPYTHPHLNEAVHVAKDVATDGAMDMGTSIGLALAYGNAAAARKAAFESAINYAIQEVGLPATYGHTTRYVGGSILGGDHRVLSGVVDRHSASFSPVTGISAGLHYHETHLLLQEGDYTVTRDSNGIGAHIGVTGGVADVSFGIGDRHERSSVLTTEHGLQTAQNWFTRDETLKPEAQMHAFGRMQDLGGLPFDKALLLAVQSPWAVPLLIFSRLPAWRSYEEFHTYRYNTDGSALSLTAGLPCTSLTAASLSDSRLLSPLSVGAQSIAVTDTSRSHQSVAAPILLQRMSNNGRTEAVMANHEINGRGQILGGVFGNDNTQTHLSHGVVTEKQYSERTSIQGNEHVTDVHGTQLQQEFVDTTHTLSQGRKFLSWWKHEYWYKPGERREMGRITYRVDENDRIRSRVDGSHYEHRPAAPIKRDDGSVLNREEKDYVQVESRRHVYDVNSGQSNNHELLHYGAFTQSIQHAQQLHTDIEPGIQLAVALVDHTAGDFVDRRMHNGVLVEAATQRVSENVSQHQRVTVSVRSRTDGTQLYEQNVGDRVIPGSRFAGHTTVHAFRHTNENVDYVVGATDVTNKWSEYAIGTATTHAVLQQSGHNIVSWGTEQATRHDQLQQTVISQYHSRVGEGQTVVGANAVPTSRTFAIGGVDEKITPVQRHVIAQRVYRAEKAAVPPSAAASASSPPAAPVLYQERVVDKPFQQIDHVIHTVLEQHSAKYDMISANTEHPPPTSPSVPDAAHSAPPSSDSILSQPPAAAAAASADNAIPSQDRLSAALDSGRVGESILNGQTIEGEAAKATIEHTRTSYGTSVDHVVNNIDYNPATNTVSESHRTELSAIRKEGKLVSGTGVLAVARDEQVVDQQLIEVQHTEVETSKGWLYNKRTFTTKTTMPNEATVKVDKSEQSTEPSDEPPPPAQYTASAATLRAANTASAAATTLICRKLAGHEVDVIDVGTAALSTGQSAVTGHWVDKLVTIDATITARKGLQLEVAALERAQKQTTLKAGAAIALGTAAFNIGKYAVNKARAHRKQEKRKRRREERERKAKEKAATANDPSVSPAAAAEEEPESGSLLSEVAGVIGSTVVDLLPVAAQVATIGMKGASLATVALSVAVDTSKTAVSWYRGKVNNEQAAEMLGTAAGTTAVATVVGSVATAGLAAAGLAGLALVIPAGIFTGLSAVASQYAFSWMWGWYRRRQRTAEYNKLCAKLGIDDPQSDDAAVRRQFRRASRDAHPDKGKGTDAQFAQLLDDYERLAELRTELNISRAHDNVEVDGEAAIQPTWWSWFSGFIRHVRLQVQEAAQPATDARRPNAPQPILAIEYIEQALDTYAPDSEPIREWQRRQTTHMD